MVCEFFLPQLTLGRVLERRLIPGCHRPQSWSDPSSVRVRSRPGVVRRRRHVCTRLVTSPPRLSFRFRGFWFYLVDWAPLLGAHRAPITGVCRTGPGPPGAGVCLPGATPASAAATQTLGARLALAELGPRGKLSSLALPGSCPVHGGPGPGGSGFPLLWVGAPAHGRGRGAPHWPTGPPVFQSRAPTVPDRPFLPGAGHVRGALARAFPARADWASSVARGGLVP